MRIRAGMTIVAMVAAAMVLAGAAAFQSAGEAEYTTNFRLGDCHFLPVGANAFVTLQAWKFRRYEGVEGGRNVVVETRVLPQFKWVSFPQNAETMTVLTRVVLEREWVGGELAEVTRRYLSRDLLSRNVFSFGEDVDIWENGQVVSHEGTWRAGVNGARPGMFMPSTFLLGSRYVQEIAPGVAEDRAEHVDMGLTVVTPAGTFTNCVMVQETTPLQPGAEGFKIYAPKLGLIKNGPLELVAHN